MFLIAFVILQIPALRNLYVFVLSLNFSFFRIMRFTAKTLQEKAKAKFPSQGDIVIAAFVFLRFFCPSIINPIGSGVLDKSKESRKMETYLPSR